MKIEKIHKENKKLIQEYNLKIGDEFKLKKGGIRNVIWFNKNDIVTISNIHPTYGWILFKETEKLPQEVKKLLEYIEVNKK